MRYTIAPNPRVGGYTVTDEQYEGPFVAGEACGTTTFRTLTQAEAFVSQNQEG